MKLGTMLTDIARGLVQAPATRQYPFEREAPPARLRGKLHWDREPCTACNMCATDCPAAAIKIFNFDKATHHIVMRFDVGACTFCGQCVLSCNKNCIELEHGEWELAAYDKRGFTSYWGLPDDVQQAVVEDAGADADATARS